METPIAKNPTMNNSILLEVRIKITERITDEVPSNIILFFPKRSARIPMGIVRMVALIAFIMKMEPRAELLYPRDKKYNCIITLNMPFPIPLKMAPTRNSFAGVETLSGAIDIRLITSASYPFQQ